MLNTIASINDSVNAFIWGVPSMICIMGVGIWLTCRSGFLQFRKFGYTLKHTFGAMFNKKGSRRWGVNIIPVGLYRACGHRRYW